MPGCKVGDMAVIIKCPPDLPENLGVTVTVLSRSDLQFDVYGFHGPWFDISCAPHVLLTGWTPVSLMGGYIFPRKSQVDSLSCVADECLQPIRGLSPEKGIETKTDKELVKELESPRELEYIK